MSLKVKLISCVIAFCMVLSLLVVGVFSLKNTYFDVSGSISFEAKGAKATIGHGTVEPASAYGTVSEANVFKEFSIDTTVYQSNVDSDSTSWRGVSLQFPTDGSDVTLTFTVTNKNDKEQLTVWPECESDTTNSNINITITGQDTINNVLANSKTSGNAETYKVTFSLKDKTKSLDKFTFSIHVELTTASALPKEEDYLTKFTFADISATNCCSVTGTSSASGGITIPSFVFRKSSPYKVLEIVDEAFKENRAIMQLSIPKTLKTIGNSAFTRCSGLMGDLNLQNVETLGESAFSYCTGFNGKLILSSRLTNIPDYAFQMCSNFTGELNFKNVESIGAYAFEYGRYTGELNLENVTSIGSYAFRNQMFTKLTLSPRLKRVEASAFEGGVKYAGELNLQNVESIGNSAFYDCSALTSIVIPASITNATNIETNAFKCIALEAVTINSIAVAKALQTNTSCGGLINLSNSKSLTTVKVKAEGLNSYTDVGSYLRSNFSCNGNVVDGYYVFTR